MRPTAPSPRRRRCDIELDAAGAVRNARVGHAPDAPTRACIEAAVGAQSYRKPPSAISSSVWVGFESVELRFSLWLLGGTSPTRLADNLDAGAGVRDIEVVGERIELELTGRRRAVLVLAADGSIVAK